MQINRIDNTNFGSAKQRFLTDNMKCSVESLLIRMNSEVSKVLEGDHYKTTMTTKLHYGNATFEDERQLTKKLNQNEQMHGFSILRIGKKTVLDIDNIKPFYKPWFYVIKQAEQILTEMRAKFYDSSVMKKEFSTVSELTPEGKKSITKMVRQFEKQRLENIIKELEEDGK